MKAPFITFILLTQPEGYCYTCLNRNNIVKRINKKVGLPAMPHTIGHKAINEVKKFAAPYIPAKKGEPVFDYPIC
jgi:hypothetical protein